jgi:hypothetical protein
LYTGKRAEGIYPTLNGQGVVLCGESITINAGSGRSDYEISEDFRILLATRTIKCGPHKEDVESPDYPELPPIFILPPS